MLWLESWDDALWTPEWFGESDTSDKNNAKNGGVPNAASPPPNPLQLSLLSQFECSLVILVHPQANNGLFRLGILRPRDLGHVAGPLVTGLMLRAPLLGPMVRSTLINALHRLSADSSKFPNSSARSHLAAAAAKNGEKRPMASAVELLLWSSQQCY